MGHYHQALARGIPVAPQGLLGDPRRVEHAQRQLRQLRTRLALRGGATLGLRARLGTAVVTTTIAAYLSVSRAEILGRLGDHFGGQVRPVAGRGRAPAERFELPDGQRIGIIASTTEPFCATCDRSRLTADGLWYLCLYARDGIDLRRASEATKRDLKGARIVVAGGIGGRFLFRPQDSLWVGIDVAKGPEDWVLYIQVGHAW